MFQTKCEFSRSCLMNSWGAKRRVASGAKAQFFLGLNVGAEAPTPVATIYEVASSYAKRAGVTAFALMLGVLIFGGNATSLPRYGTPLPPAAKDDTSSQVYQHTYDEVFQASQEASERLGYSVTAKDKDKGTISGNGAFDPQNGMAPTQCTFDILIETLNAKPETRLTINVKAKSMFGGRVEKAFKLRFLGEVHKVLSTYN